MPTHPRPSWLTNPTLPGRLSRSSPRPPPRRPTSPATRRQRPRRTPAPAYPADPYPISVWAPLQVRRRFSTSPPAHHRSRGPPIPPAHRRPPLPGRLRQSPLPMVRMGRPQIWVKAAGRCGARARPPHPPNLLGRGPMRRGQIRPTRGSPLLPYLRRASCRHRRMLRLPSRSNTAARLSPLPSTAAYDSGASGTSETGSRCSDPNARCQLMTTSQNHTPKHLKTLPRNQIHRPPDDLDRYWWKPGKVSRNFPHHASILA